MKIKKDLMLEEIDNEEDSVERDIKIFQTIGANLLECRAEIENKHEKFNCKNCEYIGDCLFAVSEAIASICLWLRDFMKENHKYGKSRKSKLDNLISLVNKEEKKTKPPNIYQ